LANTDTCDLEDEEERWAILRLHIKLPPYGFIVPANDNSNTIELEMDSDAGCCALEGAINIGNIGTPDVCKNAPQGQFTIFNIKRKAIPAAESLNEYSSWVEVRKCKRMTV
jgi:hypothetical protein